MKNPPVTWQQVFLSYQLMRQFPKGRHFYHYCHNMNQILDPVLQQYLHSEQARKDCMQMILSIIAKSDIPEEQFRSAIAETCRQQIHQSMNTQPSGFLAWLKELLRKLRNK